MTESQTIFRTYMGTHPWIKFRADYTNVDYNTWILLGEAQSKCEHMASTPLLPALAEELHTLYLAKGVRATTAIEGNTLTEEEVRRRIAGDLDLPPSREYLGQEVDNILRACNEIAPGVFAGDPSLLSPEKIMELNRMVLNKIPLDEGVVPGILRTRSVVVGNYRGAPAEDCEYLLALFCDWQNSLPVPNAQNRILFGILKAVVAHVHFAWIHPFGDGNGRTARLIEFQILLSSGVPSSAAHLLSNHYNLTRNEYYRHLEKTSRTDGDLSSFIQYAVQGFVDGIREQIGFVNTQQILVHWRDYIYSAFRNKDSKVKRRQRELVLALTERQDFVTPLALDMVRHVSPIIAEQYAGKSEKMIERDLKELARMGLVVIDREGVWVNIDLMLAFQPAIRERTLDDTV